MWRSIRVSKQIHGLWDGRLWGVMARVWPIDGYWNIVCGGYMPIICGIMIMRVRTWHHCILSETAELGVLVVDAVPFMPFDTASPITFVGGASGSTAFSPGAMVPFLVLSGGGLLAGDVSLDSETASRFRLGSSSDMSDMFLLLASCWFLFLCRPDLLRFDFLCDLHILYCHNG